MKIFGIETPTFIGTKTINGRLLITGNGAASLPPGLLSGTWFSGGSATTTKPQLLVEPSGTTSTGWSTGGTGLGVNAPSGFTGNVIDAQINGVPQLRVASGSATFAADVVLPAGNSLYIGPSTVITALKVYTAASGIFGLDIAGALTLTTGRDTGAGLYIVGGAKAGGSSILTVTPPAHTAVVAEVIDNSFAAHTMTITGSYATNRFSLFAAPTITAASALTVTNAATLAIAGAPIVGGSAIITNAYALWIQANTSRFDGLVQTVLSATGGAGLNIPHGAAPTAPVDGDVWTTTAGLFVRVNGVTVGPLS